MSRRQPVRRGWIVAVGALLDSAPVCNFHGLMRPAIGPERRGLLSQRATVDTAVLQGRISAWRRHPADDDQRSRANAYCAFHVPRLLTPWCTHKPSAQRVRTFASRKTASRHGKTPLHPSPQDSTTGTPMAPAQHQHRSSAEQVPSLRNHSALCRPRRPKACPPLSRQTKAKQ